MAIHQDANGFWQVQIQRKGIPRIRRRGFLSRDAAAVFERSYLEKYQVAAGSLGDGRLLSELIELWFVRHGAHLIDGKRQRRQLLVMATELKNPVASRLSLDQFVAYRYAKTQRADAARQRLFNQAHHSLIAMFNRLHNLREIDYTSPVCNLALIEL
ncbi:phage integrase [Methylomonas sp. 2BW1-5-20]|uniref:phage integrase n=1 Tax=Methylomonas sp. 2BW1-5-20 TaxID=3376686 RepID=UPI004050E37C